MCNFVHIHKIEMIRRRKNENNKEIYEIIITKNLPKLMSDVKSQIQEAQEISSRKMKKKRKEKHLSI